MQPSTHSQASTQNQARSAALFDMDGTLVRVNTGRLYLGWQFRRGELSPWQVLRGLLWLCQYRFGFLEASRVSKKALTTLVGKNEARFREECTAWVRAKVTPLIPAAARKEVERRKAAGDAVAIVTAGTIYAARPLAEELGIDHVLATQLEVKQGVFTGATQGTLCYGAEKVTAVKGWIAGRGLDLASCSFYSDSITDLPLLRAVGNPVVVNPDLRLRRAAGLNRWPVLFWQ